MRKGVAIFTSCNYRSQKCPISRKGLFLSLFDMFRGHFVGAYFVSVHKNQISLKLRHLLYNSMREIDFHLDVTRVTARIDSVILVESEALYFAHAL